MEWETRCGDRDRAKASEIIPTSLVTDLICVRFPLGTNPKKNTAKYRSSDLARRFDFVESAEKRFDVFPILLLRLRALPRVLEASRSNFKQERLVTVGAFFHQSADCNALSSESSSVTIKDPRFMKWRGVRLVARMLKALPFPRRYAVIRASTRTVFGRSPSPL